MPTCKLSKSKQGCDRTVGLLRTNRRESRACRATTVFYINRYSCVPTSGAKKIFLFKVTRKTEDVNRAWQFLKQKGPNYMETGRQAACGELALLAKHGVNWAPPEELSHLVITYKIVNQSEIPCISLTDTVTKMKLTSGILFNKATKNSLSPLPKINAVQIPMERISVCFLLCIITHQLMPCTSFGVQEPLPSSIKRRLCSILFLFVCVERRMLIAN